MGDFVPVALLEVQHGLPVALEAVTFDGFHAGHSGVGSLPEGFSCVHVGDVDLHGGDGNGFQGVQNGHGGMGIGGGVDDDAVHLAVCPLDFVHNVPLVVGLVLLHFQTLGAGGFIQQAQKVGESVFTVDTRLPDAQHVQVGAVDDQNFHMGSSMIDKMAATVSSAVPSLLTA